VNRDSKAVHAPFPGQAGDDMDPVTMVLFLVNVDLAHDLCRTCRGLPGPLPTYAKHPEFDPIENDLDIVRDHPYRYALLLGIGYRTCKSTGLAITASASMPNANTAARIFV
jgi:hypothetical protein